MDFRFSRVAKGEVARLRAGLRVEQVGEARLVLDPDLGVVHTLRGSAARTLDAILQGRPEIDDEAIAALEQAGILVVGALSRREALHLSTSAAALIATATLPSAVAAASTVELSISDEGGSLGTYSLPDGSTLYRLIHSSSSTDEVVRTLTVGSAPRNIQMLLVGGGGGGGLQDNVNVVTSYGGGGGGGEVRFYDLGTVAANTIFELHVGGQSSTESPSDGKPTYVRRLSGTIAEIARARGGGEGGGYLAAGRDGGSGGGGSSAFTQAGATVTVVNTSLGSNGAAGGSGTSGGGGGAGASPPTTGTSTAGGVGGSAVLLSSFFVGAVSPTVPSPRSLGAGGGGAGDETGGTAGSGGGRGGFFTYETDEDENRSRQSATSASPPVLGSGAGGGGGLSIAGDEFGDGANGGRSQGASGGIWIRVFVPPS